MTVAARDRVRVSCDSRSHAGLVCRLQGSAPYIWRGTDIYVEVGLYVAGAFRTDITDLASLTLEILPIDDRAGNPLVTETILAASFGTCGTEADWTANAADKYHARFLLSSVDTQFDMTDASENVAQFWMVIHAVSTSGERITYGAGILMVEEDGAQNGLAVVSSNPAARIQDGELQLWNPDASTWHTVYVRGAAGAETIVIGAGEA
jgi:hypothetical protein